MRAKLRSLLILLGLFELMSEFHSHLLLLWPNDHSCARDRNPNTWSYLLEETQTRPKSVDTIQSNLFDASPKDPLTASRAQSMGINYHDVSHCFEYLIDYDAHSGNSTILMGEIEPCRNGLHFEPLEHDLSVISRFELACDRQWLKQMLPLFLTLGSLLGLHLTHFIQSASEEGQANWTTSKRFWMWLAVQLMSSTLLLLLSLVKLAPISPTIIKADKSKPADYNLLITCTFLRGFIIASTLTRVVQLRDATIIEGQGEAKKESLIDCRHFRLAVVIFVAFQAFGSLLALKIFSHWYQMNSWLTSSTICLLFLSCLIERLLGVESKYSSSLPVPRDAELEKEANLNGAKVCEFCVLNEHRAHLGQNNSTCLYSNTYQPTTVPMGCIELVSDEPNTSSDKCRVVTGHDFGGFPRTLLEWTLKSQLWMLTFCLVLNYFMIQMMPDHRVIDDQNFIGYKLQAQANQISKQANNSSSSSSLLLEEQHESVQTPAHPMDKLYASRDPIELLWLTIYVSWWPIELIVLLLHLNRVSSFESSYFKLHRLFTLQKLAAKLLVAEWIVKGE